MKLIIGLGNPGKQYDKTHHNAGFLAVGFLREKLDASNFKLNKKLKAEIAETKLGKEKIILAKPITFMNNSGEAVLAVAKFYKIKPRYQNSEAVLNTFNLNSMIEIILE